MKIIDKKATISKFRGITTCSLCKHLFSKDDVFRVVEEDGLYDNDWYAICRDCLSQPVYGQFIKSISNPSE